MTSTDGFFSINSSNFPSVRWNTSLGVSLHSSSSLGRAGGSGLMTERQQSMWVWILVSEEKVRSPQAGWLIRKEITPSWRAMYTQTVYNFHVQYQYRAECVVVMIILLILLWVVFSPDDKYWMEISILTFSSTLRGLPSYAHLGICTFPRRSCKWINNKVIHLFIHSFCFWSSGHGIYISQ